MNGVEVGIIRHAGGALGAIARAVSFIQELHVPEAEKATIFSGAALAVFNNV